MAAPQSSANWRDANNWRAASASPSGTPITSQSGPNPEWRRGGGADSSSRGGGGRGGGSRWGRNGNKDGETGGPGEGRERGPDAAVAEGRRIYVGNLLYSVKPDDVEELLAAAELGTYEKIHISVDPFTGRNPGYCFVEFADKPTADAAMASLDGAPLLGRAVKTGPCRPKGPRTGGNGGEQQPQRRERQFEQGAEDSVTADAEPRGREQEKGQGEEGPGGEKASAAFNRWGDWNGARPDRSQRQPGRKDGPYAALRRGDEVAQEKRRLYVGGLPRLENQADCDAKMRELFSDFEVEAVSKPILPHHINPTSEGEPPREHRYCFVDFTTTQQAADAMAAANGKTLGGNVLKVDFTKGPSQKWKERQRFDGWDRNRRDQETGGSGAAEGDAE